MVCQHAHIVALVLEFDTDIIWIPDQAINPHGACLPPNRNTDIFLQALPCTISGIIQVVNRNNHYLSVYKLGSPFGSGVNVPPLSYVNIPVAYNMPCGSMDYYFVNSGILSPNINPLLQPFAGVLRFTCSDC